MWEAIGGLMVSELISRSNIMGLSPGWGHCIGKDTLACCGKTLRLVHVTLTVPRSSQVHTCKCVPSKLILGGNPVMD